MEVSPVDLRTCTRALALDRAQKRKRARLLTPSPAVVSFESRRNTKRPALQPGTSPGTLLLGQRIPVAERTTSNNPDLENSNAASPDRKHRRWFQDALPRETAAAPDSKSKQAVLDKGSEKKPEEPLDVTQQSSHPTEVSRSRSYFQHDERSSAGQGDRSFNRREHGRANQKDRSGDGTRDKLVAPEEKGTHLRLTRVFGDMMDSMN